MYSPRNSGFTNKDGGSSTLLNIIDEDEYQNYLDDFFDVNRGAIDKNCLDYLFTTDDAKKEEIDKNSLDYLFSTDAKKEENDKNSLDYLFTTDDAKKEKTNKIASRDLFSTNDNSSETSERSKGGLILYENRSEEDFSVYDYCRKNNKRKRDEENNEEMKLRLIKKFKFDFMNNSYGNKENIYEEIASTVTLEELKIKINHFHHYLVSIKPI
ncbi:hypothetical protein U3516DRAFT_821604 [Neocallimastix sp. 'constans']